LTVDLAEKKCLLCIISQLSDSRVTEIDKKTSERCSTPDKANSNDPLTNLNRIPAQSNRDSLKNSRFMCDSQDLSALRSMVKEYQMEIANILLSNQPLAEDLLNCLIDQSKKYSHLHQTKCFEVAEMAINLPNQETLSMKLAEFLKTE
ncbi:MAG: hypothetical protein MHMPM18_004611, partial [Marteilia pararefringens]